MVLCVLNQPKMEIRTNGGGGGNSTTTNRKRKRKLSAPSRCPFTETKLTVETAREGTETNENPPVSSPLPGKRETNL